MTITTLTVRETDANIRFSGVNNSLLESITSGETGGSGDGVIVVQSQNITIHDSELHGRTVDGAAVRLDPSEHVAVIDNSFMEGWSDIEISATNNSTVNRNSFPDNVDSWRRDSGFGAGHRTSSPTMRSGIVTSVASELAERTTR